MSSPPRRSSDREPPPGPPYLGAMLRRPWQAVRRRVLRGLAEAGFDVGPAQLSVLQYPPPDGVRPIELAEKAQISKQAANYLIAQLEERGYLERRSVRGKGRLIFLTPTGHRLIATLHRIVCDLEAKWQREIGPRRYRAFRATLARLGELTEKDPDAGGS